MFTVVEDIIPEFELKAIDRLLAEGQFVDGLATSSKFGKGVKDNEQLGPGQELRGVNEIINRCLPKNELFMSAAMPKAIRPFLVSRSQKGGGYGIHMDNAIMGTGPGQVRTDVAMTIFLSNPDDYEGGELVLEEPRGERRFKLPRGAAIVYTPNMLHAVDPVTSGQRLVAVTWLQSFIRRADRREVLFDLDTARQEIFAEEGRSRAFQLITKSYTNLVRQWAEV